jgi:hypothetical protein
MFALDRARTLIGTVRLDDEFANSQLLACAGRGGYGGETKEKSHENQASQVQIQELSKPYPELTANRKPSRPIGDELKS